MIHEVIVGSVKVFLHQAAKSCLAVILKRLDAVLAPAKCEASRESEKNVEECIHVLICALVGSRA